MTVDHASHSRYSDPGEWVALVAAVPADPVGVSEVARNLIVHYRASGLPLPAETRDDVHSRRLERILALDQSRHATPLAEFREPMERVQGCCRDHTLFCVGVLRQHGVPARSRVGFAGYFHDDYHVDHVIVEAWLGDRWRRFDPELEEPRPGVEDPTDMGPSEPAGQGFVTAAEAWMAYRSGLIDPDRYGVDPDMPLFRGPRFLFDEVIYEVAHRFGDELLLWDCWGRMGVPGEPVSESDAGWLDEVVELVLAADGGDVEAEKRLHDRYRLDEGLRPGSTVMRASPFGEELVEVRLG